MEPTALTAATISTLFFFEALKEGGKSLGAGISKLVTQLTTTIRDKFKLVGTEGLLARAEKQPTEACEQNSLLFLFFAIFYGRLN